MLSDSAVDIVELNISCPNAQGGRHGLRRESRSCR
ncbi:hypothetical protein [Faecalibacterium taiwanense]